MKKEWLDAFPMASETRNSRNSAEKGRGRRGRKKKRRENLVPNLVILVFP